MKACFVVAAVAAVSLLACVGGRNLEFTEDMDQEKFLAAVHDHYLSVNHRQKRQAEASCLYCSPGVIMTYPDWDDVNCRSFFYCIDGVTQRFDCQEVFSTTGGQTWYFNPTTKVCQLDLGTGPRADNSCINRAFDIRTISF